MRLLLIQAIIRQGLLGYEIGRQGLPVVPKNIKAKAVRALRKPKTQAGKQARGLQGVGGKSRLWRQVAAVAGVNTQADGIDGRVGRNVRSMRQNDKRVNPLRPYKASRFCG